MSNFSELEAQKYALKRASVEARNQLLSELDESKQKTYELIKTTAIVSGSLAVGYLIYSLVRSGTQKEDKTEPVVQARGVRHTLRRRLKQRILQEASMFLLGVAKDELLKFLSSGKGKGNDDTEQVTE